MHSVRFGVRRAWFLIMFVLATGVSACQSPGAPRVVTPHVALTRVNISDPGNVAGAPFYVAFDQGYFADEALDVNFVTVTQTQAVVSVATGQLQFAMSLPDVTLFNALAGGVGVKIVAAMIVNPAQARTSRLMIAKT